VVVHIVERSAVSLWRRPRSRRGLASIWPIRSGELFQQCLRHEKSLSNTPRRPHPRHDCRATESEKEQMKNKARTKWIARSADGELSLYSSVVTAVGIWGERNVAPVELLFDFDSPDTLRRVRRAFNKSVYARPRRAGRGKAR
jgi:hypothetical protein